jgi:UDP-glucose:(heptosyl)LPS alpha-1,3-glucosyltransferase
VHAAWLERRDVFVGDRLRSSPLRRYLPRHQIILALERKYFTRSHGAFAIAVSDQVVDDLDRVYRFPRSNAAVVHNGFDPAEFAPTDPSGAREAIRRELGLPAVAVVLLLVANELTRKGLPVLLDAVAALNSRDVHILLVGRSSPEPYLSHVSRAGLSDQFRYGGSRSDMGSVHAASDIFVLPTRYEAFSLAVVEALASGLPVITTDVPGARDLVIDGVNGRIQKNPVDPSELARLLEEALQDGRYRAWAANAAASVGDHTWNVLLDTALELIASRPTASEIGTEMPR